MASAKPSSQSTNEPKAQDEDQPKKNGRTEHKQPEFIWLDGELVPFNRARVHFLSPTLHYGLGVFEGIRCYATERGPATFRLKEHLKRFLDSMRVLGVSDIDHDVDTLRNAVWRLIYANNFADCYVRTLMYFEGPLGLNLDAYRPIIAIGAWEWDNFLGQKAIEQGISMMVSSATRMHPNAGMTQAKFSGQYVNSIIAKTIALRSGFDEAIMLDAEGFVTGGTGENLLLVRDKVIYTPPKSTIIEGVTRDTILTLARDLGYRVTEERITRDQLYFADEVFVCGTAAEVVGAREIDYRPIGDGQVGPLTRQLQKLYFEVVTGHSKRYQDWLEYMVLEPII